MAKTTDDELRFSISDCKKGATFMLVGSTRIAQVTGKGVVSEPGPNNTVVHRPIVDVRVTSPTMEIPGFVSKDEAETGTIVLDALKIKVWSEKWAECFVPKIRVNKRGAAYTDPDDPDKRLQLYCLSESTRDKVAAKTSAATNKEVLGLLIPAKDVPKELFGDE